MAYTALDSSKPAATQTGPNMTLSAHDNILAVRDILAAGGFVQGWDYSVAGGTAEQPAQMFYKRGAEWIKVDLTWGTTGGENGNVTKSAYYYSSNSGGAYDPMADAAGEYVLHISYDANGNVTSTSWDATP
jgi:hypothetical protein